MTIIQVVWLKSWYELLNYIRVCNLTGSVLSQINQRDLLTRVNNRLTLATNSSKIFEYS